MSHAPDFSRRARRAAIVGELVLQRSQARYLLEGSVGISVVRMEATITDFLRWLRGSDRSQWPHLLVLDPPSAAPPGQGLSMITALREAGMRVLLLTSRASRATIRRFVESGVDGVVTATDTEQDFVAAAETVLAGGTIFTSRALAVLEGPATAPQLSVQEERVLALYATGLTIAEVADSIGVRHETAKKYLARVRNKYTEAGRPARTKLDLARIAWADGYADPYEQRARPQAQTR